LAGRHRQLRRVRDLDRLALDALEEGQGGSVSKPSSPAVPGNEDAVAVDPHAPVPAEPIDNPGLPAHEPRPTDVDPKAEKRAERQVATLFGISVVAAVPFCDAHFTFDSRHAPDTFMRLGAANFRRGQTHR